MGKETTSGVPMLHSKNCYVGENLQLALQMRPSMNFGVFLTSCKTHFPSVLKAGSPEYISMLGLEGDVLKSLT